MFRLCVSNQHNSPPHNKMSTASLLPKKWRKAVNQSQSHQQISEDTTNQDPNYTASWKHQTSVTWCKIACGRQIALDQQVALTSLCEPERQCLQKLSRASLVKDDLGCPVNIPKDWAVLKRTKKSGFSLKRRALSGSVLDKKTKEIPASSTSGWVFGIPLARCIATDQSRRRLLRNIDEDSAPRSIRKSSSSSGGAASSCSDCSDSNLFDALSLSSSSVPGHSTSPGCQASTPRSTQHSYQGQTTYSAGGEVRGDGVPYIVKVCIQHLEQHGVHVLGIFRIGSSKKRTNLLRAEFDTGLDVSLTPDHSAHDVAAILKEYLRDLPDCLLTRELYPAFIASRKVTTVGERLFTLHRLLCMLPAGNRNTLFALLHFLNFVVSHSEDKVDSGGVAIPGNKMGFKNLATLFGPNILRLAAANGTDDKFQVESPARAMERQDVISVSEELLRNYKSLFMINAESYSDMLKVLQEVNPMCVDSVLEARCSRNDIQML